MSTPVYVRVKDESTGHEFDVRQDSPLLAAGRVKRVKDDRYPPSTVQRRPKHHIDLAGPQPASRETGSAPAEPEPSAAPAAAAEATKKKGS